MCFYLSTPEVRWAERVSAVSYLEARVGDPIVERLQRRGNYTGFHMSANRKQQLIEGLIVAIQRREIRFPDGPIRKELESFEFEYTATRVIYQASAGMHDDCVIALALAHDGLRNRPGQGVWLD